MPGLRYAHDLGRDLFGEDRYTVERREFADGDTRTIVKHSVGVSATCYITVQVWIGRGSVWVEYYEGDDRRAREVLETDEFDPDRDPAEYIFPSD